MVKRLGIIKSNLQDFRDALLFKLKIRDDFKLFPFKGLISKDKILGCILECLTVIEIRRSNFFKAIFRRIANFINEKNLI